MLQGAHTPVFCISDIPEATLDYFLQCIEQDVEEQKERFSGIDDHAVSEEIAFITSKDLSAITSGAMRPAKAFTSPFLGESIEQVRDWFVDNIVPSEGYTGFSFLVMDSQTEEDNTCLLVCILGDELQTLRCDFEAAQVQITMIEFGSEIFKDGTRGPFVETGEVMTKEKMDLALKGLLYVEDGKLKTKET